MQGKAIIVTGASSGIGRAVALRLGQAGGHVSLAARSTAKLNELAQQIEVAGGQALVAGCDVTDERQVVGMMNASFDRWGRLDALINAAGVGLSGTIMDGLTEDWRQMFEVNVIGLAVTSREALKRFDASGGHIVHVSSMAGHRVPPGSGMYAATKFAVRGLTEIMRTELRNVGRPVRISEVSPGLVDTPFFEHYHRGDANKVEDVRTRYKKILQPVDIAEIIVHILETPPHVEIHDVLIRSTYQQT